MAAKTNSTPFTKKKAIIFVTGMSGTGKSTVLKELSLKGHKIVDTDYDGLIVYGTDPRWGPGWLWDEKRMKSILPSIPKVHFSLRVLYQTKGNFIPILMQLSY